MAQPPNLVFDLLFVSTVAFFEHVSSFAHILTLTFLASSKVNYKRAGATQFLLDRICSLGVGACEFPPLLQNWAGNLALSTFETPWVGFNFLMFLLF